VTARATTATRSILLKLSDGSEKIVEGIPAMAKITFGALQPGKDGGYGRQGQALRIYTTTNNQLAVFVGVDWFRDLSLTVKERKKVASLKRKAEAGPNGKLVEVHDEETYGEWETVQA
jgi:hypothetical protein